MFAGAGKLMTASSFAPVSSEAFLDNAALELCEGQESNLKAILEHSVFRDENELKKELKGYRTGTKILIWNLKRVEDDILELDFASDVKDIRCPKAFETVLTSVHDRPVEQNKSEYMHSLREYCSILYLKPKMKIIIRGHKVKRKLISRCLANKRKFSYTPSCSVPFLLITRPEKVNLAFRYSIYEKSCISASRNTVSFDVFEISRIRSILPALFVCYFWFDFVLTRIMMFLKSILVI
ncbi:hypothetical protein RRG08_053014 [Elysia crispata]|uniref:Morc S5 domain-containing protein n=1 Tax=Elysia crispata TaxID=231223 RepID=A0AAE0YL19_9GAST|nr:hypothetical protein RRG08_053014 [Elysia crispata]